MNPEREHLGSNPDFASDKAHLFVATSTSAKGVVLSECSRIAFQKKKKISGFYGTKIAGTLLIYDQDAA